MTGMFPRLHRLFRHESGSTALLVAFCLLLPLCLYGPWVPLTDLVAFCGLDSYPPQLSYGPQHYYLFQFTYILPMILSRAFVDLGLGPRIQVPLFYLAQMGCFLCFVWRALELVLPNAPWRRLAIVLGGLAAWDGLFLWGGPFAFSMGAAFLAVVTWLSLREAAYPERTAPWPAALLTLLAVASHPFALPFALMLFAVRLLFLRRSRLHSAGVIAALLVAQVIITRESPEPIPGPILTQLFSLIPEDLPGRFQLLFDWNPAIVEQILGVQPVALLLYFILGGCIRLAGFLCSPLVAWRAKDAPALRMLALLNTGVLVLYLFSRENALITMWPQRILTFHACLTFVSGVATPWYLWQTFRRAPAVPAVQPPRRPWLLPVAEGAALAFLLAVQIPIFALAPAIEANLRAAKQALFATGVRDAVLITRITRVTPFYLRAVPFLLFSDPEVIERRLLLSTEWHTQPRHPTRILETAHALGRPRYTASFAKEKQGLLTLELQPLP